MGVTGCPVPIWDPQGLQPKGRVLLTALEKQGENQAGRGEIMSSVSDMFSFSPKCFILKLNIILP